MFGDVRRRTLDVRSGHVKALGAARCARTGRVRRIAQTAPNQSAVRRRAKAVPRGACAAAVQAPLAIAQCH